MHLRRALLLFALVLGLTALATAVAPAPPGPDNGAVQAPPPRPPVPPETVLSFQAPAPHGRIPRRKVLSNAHVLVQVAATEGGQVAIPALGQVAPVTAGAPASFDLLDLQPGSYEVTFEPALGSPAPVGMIVSR